MGDHPAYGDDTIHERTMVWARVDLERLSYLEEKVDSLEAEMVELQGSDTQRLDISWRTMFIVIAVCATSIVITNMLWG